LNDLKGVAGSTQGVLGRIPEALLGGGPCGPTPVAGFALERQKERGDCPWGGGQFFTGDGVWRGEVPRGRKGRRWAGILVTPIIFHKLRPGFVFGVERGEGLECRPVSRRVLVVLRHVVGGAAVG